jgi:DNA-binding NarL/FixJ family response regulator
MANEADALRPQPFPVRPAVVDARRTVVVSDIRIFREGLAALLAERGFEVVSAADAESGLEAVRAHRPKVALVDAGVPAAIEAIRRHGTTSIVVLGMGDTEQEVIACAEAGVSGYVTRDDSFDDLVAALESAARSELLCSPRMAAVLLRRVGALAGDWRSGAARRLTPRELEVVELIDEGLSNKEIARRLSIELPTVKNHVHNILDKLQVRRRGEAVACVRGRTRGELGRERRELVARPS